LHLVHEALRERATMARAAPHLVRALPFVLPVYRRWELPYYGAGLLLYDKLSGKSTMGPTRVLDAAAAAERVPGLARRGLAGGVLFHDGQFNDARFALALARTAIDHGATVVNYARCERLMYEGGRVCGAVVRDGETGAEATARARVVVNATGSFSDALRRQDDATVSPLLALSRGTHIVVGADVLGGDAALIVPKTRDGRVIFAIPWQGRVVIGTTDVPVTASAMEPGHVEAEIDYLLETAEPYLERRVQRSEILSVFSGLRPLVSGKGVPTSKLSREHAVEVARSGLITIAGGKWTTYRRMAEETLDAAIERGMLRAAQCATGTLRLHGAGETASGESDPYLREYGSDGAALRAVTVDDASLAEPIDTALPYSRAQVAYAVRAEMARTVEDVLSRRTRALLLDAQATVRAAPAVAGIMARELGRDDAWAGEQTRQFTELARMFYAA
jgi:glycerol-3-phosphate dehydrogenase